MSFEAILFYIVLIDSIGANFMAWFGQDWYIHHCRIFSRSFPASRGWTAIYLLLVIWIGTLLSRIEVIF